MINFRMMAVLALTAALAPASWALFLVVPGAWTSTEGPTNNTFPVGSTGVRYQQVYGASEFGSSPIVISGMRFRRDGPAGGTGFSDTITWSMSLSTTSAAVDGLSTTFASNIGGDAVSVFSGTQTFSSSSAAGPPRGFDAAIIFSTPFTYTPGSGNLLWDVTRTSTNVSHPMDAVSVVGDSVSRLFASSAAATTGTASTLGLITEFEYAPVPEPATLAVLGLGFAALLRRRRR